MRPHRFISALSLLVLLGASPVAAIIHCGDCTCSHSCAQPCGGFAGVPDCGTMGVCAGAPGCGGGSCLTAGDTDALRAILETASAQPEGRLRGQIAARLTWRLAQFVEEAGLGAVYAAETGFQLARIGPVRAADLAFVSRERLESGRKIGTPDLVVEIASSTAGTTTARVEEWLVAGARVVLVVDPAAKTLSVHRRSGAETLALENVLELPDVVPGWQLRVADLFE